MTLPVSRTKPSPSPFISCLLSPAWRLYVLHTQAPRIKMHSDTMLHFQVLSLFQGCTIKTRLGGRGLRELVGTQKGSDFMKYMKRSPMS
ncbi:unnamed protein product [Arabidopsis halleri]